MTSKATGSLSVTIANDASASMRCEVSTNSPSTRPAIAAFAKPAPMLAATSATVTAASNERWLPSGKVITGMTIGLDEEKSRQFNKKRTGPRRERRHAPGFNRPFTSLRTAPISLGCNTDRWCGRSVRAPDRHSATRDVQVNRHGLGRSPPPTPTRVARGS